jgi:hypothetical protein
MRVLGDVEVARLGYTLATAWAGPSRVLAVVLPEGCCGARDTVVVGVDASERRLLWRRTLGGSLQAGARFGRSLVLVLGPLGRGIGPSRLVVVGPDGRIRSARLAEIRSGSEWSETGAGFVGRTWNPGLAVDPAGARAFVVQAGAPVAAVDLRTLRVRYHALSEPVALRLEPTAAAKAEEGPTRQALWLGDGLLAVAGRDSHRSVDARGREAQWDTPAGLKLIDTRSWSVKTIDERASSVASAAGTVLAFSLLYDSRDGKASGSGLTGYDLDGTRRFHLLGELRIPPLGVEVYGPYAYVGGALVDVRAGRFVTWVSTGASLLLGDGPIWY